MPDFIVRQAQVVRPEGVVRADVVVEAGKIVEVAPEVSGSAGEEIPAEGLHLFPGVIDVHVHFNEPGQAHWEGIATGSAAFAAGGGAVFFDMPLNSVPCTLDALQFDRKLAAMRASSHTDFALWGGLTPLNLDRLPELAERGAVGFKAFMSNSGLPEFPHADDATLYEGMKICAGLSLPVAVHAESDALTAHLSQKLRAAGRREWRDYLASRPVLAELEAISRALLIARDTGCKLHVVHISSGSGVALAAEAKARGADVSLETCPHYLAFTEEDLGGLGAVGKCAPPLRGKDEFESLWEQVLSGRVNILGSDHSPSPPEMKQGTDFFALWGGISGVQSTLAVLLTEGFDRRGLALGAIARMLADAPAKRFGLAGKGGIEPGHDADFALVDLTQHHTLTADKLLYRHKQSPYLGRTFTGAVRSTWVRGQQVWDGQAARPLAQPKLIRPTTPG